MRAGKKTLILVVVLFLLVAGFVLFLPAMINAGLARGAILAAVEKNVSGTADIDTLDLSWGGPQQIDGLQITSPAGEKVVDVNVTVDSNLLALVLSSYDVLRVAISGEVDSAIRQGGSSVQDILPQKDVPPSQPKPAKPRKAIDLAISDMTMRLRYEDAGTTTTISDLNGSVVLKPDDMVTADLKGATTTGDVNGSIEFSFKSDDLVRGDGSLSPSGATAQMKLIATSLVVPQRDTATDQVLLSTIDSLNVSLQSDNLAERAIVETSMRASRDGQALGELDGALTVIEPFTKDGVFNVGLDSITGSIHGEHVPTALLQTLLAGAKLPIDPVRDFGPELAIDADFSAGQQKDVNIKVSGEQIDTEIVGTVDPVTRAISGSRLLVRGNVHPQLVAALSEISLSHPAAVELDLSRFHIPPSAQSNAEGASPTINLADAGATGSLRLMSAVGVQMPNWSEPITVESVDLTFGSQRLGDGVQVTGSAMADGSTVTIDERITGLLDPQGKLAIAGAMPVGTMSYSGTPSVLLSKLSKQPPSSVVKAFTSEPLTASIATTDAGSAIAATIDVQSPQLNATVNSSLESDRIVVNAVDAQVNATPELMQQLQQQADTAGSPDAAAPIALNGPATISLTMEPFVLQRDSEDGFSLPQEPVHGTITIPQAAASNVPGVVEPVGVRNVNAALALDLVRKSYGVKGVGQVQRAVNGAVAGDLHYDLMITQSDEKMVPSGTVKVANFSMVAIESLLGREAGSFSKWTGDAGAVNVSLEGIAANQEGSLDIYLPRLSGKYAMARRGDMMSVTTDNGQITLDRAALQSALNPTPAGSTEPAQPKLTVGQDLPMSIRIRELRLPTAMLQKERFDPSAFELDAAMTGGGPLQLVNATGERTDLEDIRLALNSANIADGIGFSLNSQAGGLSAESAGEVAINGSIRNLVSSSSVLDTFAAKLHLDADVNKAPTVILDAMLRQGGVLVAAVGPQMSAQMDADDFSSSSGTFNAAIETTNGSLHASLVGGDNSFRTAPDKPVTAQLALTEPLREVLLSKVHPVLADIRTTEHPIQASLDNAVIPVGGDISRLNADIRLSIGKVEFDAGSAVLGPLGLFENVLGQLVGGESASNVGERVKTVPGSIEPIVARIRAGVLTYDKFAVQVDKYTLNYNGVVDLVQKAVNLRTEIPLDALGSTFQELRGLTPGIVIPFVTRGTFGNLKTEIDPDFDVAGALIDAGIKRGIGDLLKDSDGKSILDEILGGEKQDQTTGDGVAEDSPQTPEGEQKREGPLGGLIGDLLRDRKKKDEKEEEGEDEPSGEESGGSEP